MSYSKRHHPVARCGHRVQTRLPPLLPINHRDAAMTRSPIFEAPLNTGRRVGPLRLSGLLRVLSVALATGTVVASGTLMPGATRAFAQASPGGVPAAASQPPADMAAPVPSARIEPKVGGLFKQRIAIEDERQALSMAAAAIENRARFIDFMQRARLSGIAVDDIPLPNATQSMLSQADAHARQQTEAAEQNAAKERAAKEQAAKDLAERSPDAAPNPGGQSPAAAGPTAASQRRPANVVPVTDDSPRLMFIGGVSPRLYATLVTTSGIDNYQIGDQLPNGWKLTAVSRQNGVTAIDKSGTPRRIDHISVVR